MADGPRIAPELLSYVEDYIEEEDINYAAREDELDSESNLMVFYRELFSQFFANVVGERITGLGPRSGEKARELYQARKDGWSDSERRLMRDYLHFTKIYPDLLGETYGSSEAIGALHVDLLPDLLHHLEQWARDAEEPELATAAAAAFGAYSEFLDEFEVSDE